MTTATQSLKTLKSQLAAAQVKMHQQAAAGNERLEDYWCDQASWLAVQIGRLRRELELAGVWL